MPWHNSAFHAGEPEEWQSEQDALGSEEEDEDEPVPGAEAGGESTVADGCGLACPRPVLQQLASAAFAELDLHGGAMTPCALGAVHHSLEAFMRESFRPKLACEASRLHLQRRRSAAEGYERLDDLYFERVRLAAADMSEAGGRAPEQQEVQGQEEQQGQGQEEHEGQEGQEVQMPTDTAMVPAGAENSRHSSLSSTTAGGAGGAGASGPAEVEPSAPFVARWLHALDPRYCSAYAQVCGRGAGGRGVGWARGRGTSE